MEDFLQIEELSADWRILNVFNHVRQVEGFPADFRISDRLEDFSRSKDSRQIGGYPADWRKIFGRFENSRKIGRLPADWTISGRLEDFRQIEDF